MIEIRNLSKTFDRSSLYTSLDLTIPEKSITVILGKSGEGKSLLLKHILGLMLPDAGQILIEGTDITKLDTRQRRQFRLKFGMVFQHSALLDSLTVAENVALGLKKLTRKPDEEIYHLVRNCLRAVNLEETADLLPEQLSGGMRKRIAFARAIVMEPEYLLYDEPTSGLDPVTGEIIANLILQFSGELEATSLVVTHDVGLTLNIADYIALLADGEIQSLMTPNEFRETENQLARDFLHSIPQPS